MLQVTAQDYRSLFIDEDYPLTQIAVHRSVAKTFVDKASELGLNLTTRNVFDYLMHNANADKRANNYTFGETAPIDNNAIAARLGKKSETIRKAIIKLVKADLIQRHPVKRTVYIIPSMSLAKAQLSEQVKMKRAINITKAAEKRIAEMEAALGHPLIGTEKKRIYAHVLENFGNKQNGDSHPSKTLPLPF